MTRNIKEEYTNLINLLNLNYGSAVSKDIVSTSLFNYSAERIDRMIRARVESLNDTELAKLTEHAVREAQKN